MKEIHAFLTTIGILAFYFMAGVWLTAPHAGEMLTR